MGSWSDTGYLCKAKTSLDKFRRPKKDNYEEREVFCNKIGVNRTEFYQAGMQGYKAELCVEIHECDFEGEEYFKFGGKKYRILKHYPVKNESLELVCGNLVPEAQAYDDGE